MLGYSEAELAGKIRRFSKGDVIKPCAALIIGGLVTGIIFALVMSNPVFLLVGLGFSAIGVGMMAYKRVEYLKLIRDSQDEGQKTKKIFRNIANNDSLKPQVAELKANNSEHPFIAYKEGLEARRFEVMQNRCRDAYREDSASRKKKEPEGKALDTLKWAKESFSEIWGD